MDIRFEDDRKKGRSPTTRLYLPKEGEEEEPSTRHHARTRAGRRAAHEPGVRVKNPEITSFGRVGLIISGFLFAGMVLFTLAGYERISRAYADINALNDEIELTKLRINELDVQIECAVTIQDAQQIAEAYGMRYPEKSQYIRIGDPLPFSNSAPAESTVPEDTADPNTDGTGGGEQPPAGG